MADNLNVTAGSGTTIATDDISGVHYQKVKLIESTAESTTATGVSGNPLRVDPTGSTAQPVTDNGSSLTVDGTVAVLGTVAVTDNSSTLSVDDGGSTLTVDGTVTANLSATDNTVLDSIDTSTQGILADTASIQTAVELIDDVVKAEDAAHQSGDKGVMTLAVRQDTQSDFGADGDYVPLSVDADGKLRVAASVSAEVTIGSEYDEDAAHQSGDTGSFVLAVRKDTAASLAGTDGDYAPLEVDANGRLHTLDQNSAAIKTAVETLDNAISGNEMQVDVVTMPTVAVTQSGTWDEIGINDSGNSITVDGTVTANLGATDNAVLDDIAADTEAIKTAVEGTLTVTGGGGGVEYTEGDTDASITGSAAMMEVGSDTLQPIQGTVAGGLLVNLGSNNDVTVTGTVDLGATDNAVLDNIDADLTTIIGHVDGAEGLLTTIDSDTGGILTSVQTLDNAISGSEMQVDIVTIPDVTVVGKAADGAGVSGNPIRVAGSDGSTTRSLLTDSGGRLILGAGTNAFGKLAANSGVDIGDVDVTSLPALAAGTNAIGKLLPSDVDVTAHTNYARKYYTNAGAVTDGIVWSPAAGKRWHVVTLYIQTSADATITLEDDKAGGDDPVWKGEIAAKSGVTLSFTEKYPMASGEDAADLTITTTAGNVYVTAVGYEI